MPNSPNGRPHADIQADVQARLDLQPARALCLHCPDWSHEGTALECRTAAASHRRRYHPDTRVTKRRRRNVSRFDLGLTADRVAGNANALATAAMLARREPEQAA